MTAARRLMTLLVGTASVAVVAGLAPATAADALVVHTATAPTAAAPTAAARAASAHRAPVVVAPVTELTFVANTTRSITFSWTVPAHSRIAGVMIRRSAGKTAPATPGSSRLVARVRVKTTTFTDSNLTPGRTYSYSLFGFDNRQHFSPPASLTSTTLTGNGATGLSGRVLDPSGQPITRVQVSVYGVDGPGGTTETGTDGRYQVTGLVAGSYTVCFGAGPNTTGRSQTGYVSVCYLNQAPIDGPSGTPVTVTAGRIHRDIDQRMTPGGAIAGRVTDVSTQPVPHTIINAVRIEDSSRLPFFIEDSADGRYVIKNLPAGSYIVCFDPPVGAVGPSPTGSLAQCYGHHVASDTEQKLVTVTLGRTTSPIDVTLDRAAALTGLVTDPLGRPVPDVLVELSQPGQPLINFATTDATGHYRLNGITAGTYNVCFNPSYFGAPPPSTPGGHQARCYGDVPYNYQGAGTPVALTSGQVSTADAVLPIGAGFIGHVTDATNSGLANVNITVYDDQGFQAGFGTTDAAGAFTVSALNAGTYTICADPAFGAPAYILECYQDAVDQYSATPVSTTAGTAPTVDFVLTLGAVISGKITNAAGQPIPGVTVGEEPDSDGSINLYATSGDDGTYQIGGLRAGTYFVCAYGSDSSDSSPTGYATNCYGDSTADQPRGTSIPVAAGGTATANITLSPGAAVAGTIVGPDGTPEGNAAIEVRSIDGFDEHYSFSDDAGHYRVNGLTAGTVSVCVDGSFGSQPLGTACYDGQPGDNSSSTPVAVTAGATTTVDVTLPAA